MLLGVPMKTGREERTSDLRRRTSVEMGGHRMWRPRGARVVASRGQELEVTIRGTLAASALARHCEATGVSLLYLTIDGVVYIPCYDNNGNITRYLNANGGTFARYSYDAFGRLIARAGRRASFFRHRFSTKYFDSETGLYYYGYRFYHPGLMRWLNRDPIEEDGGVNLYGFVKNNTICHVDIIGLYTMADAEKSLKAKGVLKGGTLGLFYSEMQLFSEWLSLERTRGSWWSVLPKCPKRICISKSGKPINPDPAIWQDPEPLGLNKINHPGGTFEMRSKPIGHYANQCIYDAAGVLMTRPPAAGTVDYYSTSGYLREHFFHDLRPFHYSRNLRRIPDYYSVRPSW